MMMFETLYTYFFFLNEHLSIWIWLVDQYSMRYVMCRFQ